MTELDEKLGRNPIPREAHFRFLGRQIFGESPETDDLLDRLRAKAGNVEAALARLQTLADMAPKDQTRIIDNAFLHAGAVGPAGWNKVQLRVLGIVWPPAKGWKRRLIGTEISESTAQEFLSLRGQRGKKLGRKQRNQNRGKRKSRHGNGAPRKMRRP